jgi:thioredoxin-like negative regulator of GroEL
MRILKFGAQWCTACAQLDRNLESVELPLNVEQIDVAEDTKVAIAYNIRALPTLLVLDRADREVSRKVGVMKAEEIQEWLTSL